jgi:hypothetical protein
VRTRSIATLGILALLVAASAFGQQRLRADIPFEFHFGDTVMPAGQYDVHTDVSITRDVLSVDCLACQSHAFAVTIAIGGGAEPSAEGRLVFHKYGDTYFFAEVWVPGRTHGGALSESKTERELARAAPDVSRVVVPARTSRIVMARR